VVSNREKDEFEANHRQPSEKAAEGAQVAVEIRNKGWLVPKLADVLREHGVALTLIDQGWMPRPWEMKVLKHEPSAQIPWQNTMLGLDCVAFILFSFA